MQTEGGCYCGSIRYKIKNPPAISGLCYCRACQHISGGEANLFIMAPPDQFQYMAGKPATFRKEDLPSRITREFCIKCGTHLTSHRPGFPQIIVKKGTLDEPKQAGAPKFSIFTAEKQPHHQLRTDIPALKGLPPLGSN